MEFETIEREVYVDASPEVVFEVVSSPDHVKQWWADEARYEPTPGSVGEIVFLHKDRADNHVQLQVVDAEPPHRFSFRWTQPEGVAAVRGNSLLVTFELVPSGSGTLLKMTESGFGEMLWEPSELERQYQMHATGWEFFIPRIPGYASTLAVSS